MDRLIDDQSIIIALDVDALLYDKLKQVIQAGFSVVEINSSDPSLLSGVLREFPSLKVGAGNIMDTQQLELCHQAGVHFITSPGFTPAIAQTATLYSINYLPGIATISEAMQAMYLGLHYLRPFPANLEFCILLNKYLPLIRLFPAEIKWEEVDNYLNLPAVSGISILNPETEQLRSCPRALPLSAYI